MKYIFTYFIFFVSLSTVYSAEHHSISFDTNNSYFNESDEYQKEVKNTVLQVISDIEELIIPRHPNKIKIKVNAVNKKTPALAYFVPKYEDILLNRNGINTGKVWQKYNTTNINPADSTYDGEFYINFNYEYNTIYSEIDPNKYDLYSIILHEYIHSLGFFSMIKENGTSLKTNYKQGLFSLFDTRLYSDTNRLINYNTNNLLTFNQEYIPTLKDECAISFLGDLPIVFSPAGWQGSSSISHIDTNCLDKQFVMAPSIYKGKVNRTPSYEDLYIIVNLGYDITGNFRGETILSDEELNAISDLKVAIANNDYIDTIKVVDNNILKIPVSHLINNDSNISEIVVIDNQSFELLNAQTYSLQDTIILSLGSYQNPYQLNYYSISDNGLYSNPARVNITIPIENSAVGECKRSSRNLICNGDFEQVTTIGALKLDTVDYPSYGYNRNDTFEPCVTSKFLAGWNLTWTPDIYTYKEINEISVLKDIVRSLKYDPPFREGNFIKRPNPPKKYNNYILGLYTQNFSNERLRNGLNLDTTETISQELIDLKVDTKYYLELEVIPRFLGNEDSLYVLFSNKMLCEKDLINFPENEDYLLFSHPFHNKSKLSLLENYKWNKIVFKNLIIGKYNYIYIFANKDIKEDSLSHAYYFIDNIVLRPMSYGVIAEDLNYNFCESDTLSIPVKIEKEIEEADTLVVKVANERLNFETDGKLIEFGEGTKDTIIYFSATYNEDYRLNPEYLLDIELISNKKGELGTESLTLTIKDNDLEIDIWADEFCNKDSVLINVEITQKGFSSIKEGSISITLPRSLQAVIDNNILENTLDPSLQYFYNNQTDNFESIYQIYLNNTLGKSTVHGIEEDLKIRIRFATKMDFQDSLNIIKTETNLFADGCKKVQYDTLINNSLRNRLLLKDTTVCSSLDLSKYGDRDISVVGGVDTDDLLIEKSGLYTVSYLTNETCFVTDSFNVEVIDDFYLDDEIVFNDSSEIYFRFDSKFHTNNDTIRDYTNRIIHKIYPVESGNRGNGKSNNASLSPDVELSQIADTLFYERNYNISNVEYDERNEHYSSVRTSYPLADSIVIETTTEYYDGCSNNAVSNKNVYYLKDSNRIYNYKQKDRIINLYPNPADSKLTLEFESLKQGMYNFSIYNLIGERVFETSKVYKKGSFRETFDIEYLVNGTYSVVITSPMNVYHKKFMVFK